MKDHKKYRQFVIHQKEPSGFVSSSCSAVSKIKKGPTKIHLESKEQQTRSPEYRKAIFISILYEPEPKRVQKERATTEKQNKHNQR
jgi:hypothetical protein